MSQIARPTDETELAGIVADAADAATPLEIVGNGSKRNIGRTQQTALSVTTRNLRGITLYEPSEMVISALSGTPLTTIESELAKYNQQLAFEPIDYGPMLGQPSGQASWGGVFATNSSGARRLLLGAARDHLLGIRAVNGRGEIFKSGGRVMKNVTGYDLVRGLAGSWGTLGVMTELTAKVLPRAEESRTLILLGQPDVIAVEVMCAAMGMPYEVSAALHLQPALAARLENETLREAGKAVTALRIENFSPFVARRAEKLKAQFQAYGEMIEFHHSESVAFWGELRRMSYFENGRNPVWRISTAPTMGPKVVQAISGYIDCNAAYDWSGGLVWLEVPGSADAGSADIRRVIATRGGHAMLIRAEPAVRASVEVFQPLEAAVARITRGIKQSFDPAGILNPGRMYADI